MGESEPPIEETETRLVSMVPLEGSAHASQANPCLVLMTGPHAGEMYRLSLGETVLGRSQELRVRLVEDGVSRRHARLMIDARGANLEDMKSVNGTFLNGDAVGVASLKNGDRIQLGPTTILKFVYADATEETFQRQLHEAALRDPLTGSFNRAYLDQRLASELAFAIRHKAPIGLIMMDLDHFKSVNDTFGHLAGDDVLRQFARRVELTLRTEDMLARYGGEEFCVLCRGIPPAGVLGFAERLREVVARAPFVHGAHNLPVTVSAGVAAFADATLATAAGLVRAADDALFRAKQEGRNRCVAGIDDGDLDDPPTQRFSLVDEK